MPSFARPSLGGPIIPAAVVDILTKRPPASGNPDAAWVRLVDRLRRRNTSSTSATRQRHVRRNRTNFARLPMRLNQRYRCIAVRSKRMASPDVRCP